ncbi:MAG: helix-turn-helix domain-containing protein [Clostridia bacterium]|nr:helix-turn-helix domain-containing protein [Clostridia bacterium]
MLSENIKTLRKAKGLSQDELAIKLNVVRQTISKWEKGLSVPDSEMLIRIAEELDTTVMVLLGETAVQEEPEDLKALSVKLELLNEQFARQNETRRKIWRVIFVAIAGIAGAVLLGELIQFIYTQAVMNSIEESTAIIGGADGPTRILIAGTVNPIEEWVFAVIAAAAAGVGIYKTRRR